jgi:hypothetical protein
MVCDRTLLKLIFKELIIKKYPNIVEFDIRVYEDISISYHNYYGLLLVTDKLFLHDLRSDIFDDFLYAGKMIDLYHLDLYNVEIYCSFSFKHYLKRKFSNIIQLFK